MCNIDNMTHLEMCNIDNIFNYINSFYKIMAKKNKIFIIRDENVTADNIEEMQSTWLEENHPDKTIIGGEENNTFIVNEEDNAMMCMEFIKYDN